MTKFQALYVVYLSTIHYGTWRWTAARYRERYDEKIPFQGRGMSSLGNQIDGMMLCEEAEKLLGLPPGYTNAWAPRSKKAVRRDLKHYGN